MLSLGHLQSLQVPFATGLLSLVGLTVLGKLIRKYWLIPRITILDDLPKLGTKRLGQKLPGTAIICGGR